MGKAYNYAANIINDFYPDAPNVNVETILVSKNNSNEDMSRLKSRYGFNKVTQNLDEIINDKAIDAVYIGTPNNLHCEQAKRCIEARKHVLCDKPISTSLLEADTMLKTANEAGIIANMVFEYRFIPAISKIKEIIDSGILGEIIQFRALYLHGSYIEERPKTWRLMKNTGGALVDLAPHLFDLVHFLIGKFSITHSKVVTKIPNREVDDIALMLCETQSNADGYIEVSRLSSGSVDDLRLEIHGKKGAVKWNLEELNYFHLFNKNQQNEGFKKIPCFSNDQDMTDFPPPKVTTGWLMPHVHCLYNFVKEISDPTYEDMRTPKFADGYYVQSLIDKIKDNV